MREQAGDEHLRVPVAAAPASVTVRGSVVIDASARHRSHHVRRVETHRLDARHDGPRHGTTIVDAAAFRRFQIERAFVVISNGHFACINGPLHIRYRLLSEVPLVIHAILGPQQLKLALLSLPEGFPVHRGRRRGRKVRLDMPRSKFTLLICSSNSVGLPLV